MPEPEDSRGSRGGGRPLLSRASDERLARLAGRGEERAFAALYERYHQPLYRLCLSIVRTPEDARDALQSTFERAFAALRAREREIAVRPWLFRIAHNESISVLRRRHPDHGPPDAELPSTATVESTVDERARLAALVADIHSLPARQRSVLLMRELSGLSIADIAIAMSMSGAAVKQTLFEARGSLHSYAEGRAMPCEDVRRAISDGDGRALRARKLRAHLRDCPECAEFRSLISAREAHLRALAPPLPAAAAATMLASLLAHGARTHAGAAAASGSSALAAAKGGASSLALKGVTGLVLAGAIGAGAAHLASQPATHARAPVGARTHARTHARGRAGSAGGRAATAHVPSAHVRRAPSGRARATFAPATSSPSVRGEARGSSAHAAVPVRAHGAPSHARPGRGRRSRGTPVKAHVPSARKLEQPRGGSHSAAPAASAPEHAKHVPAPHTPASRAVSP